MWTSITGQNQRLGHRSCAYELFFSWRISEMVLTKFTIYGERCSGTNFLEQSVCENFDAAVTWEYGHKHFFGFQDLSHSDDTLFLGIVRDGFDWINSLRRNPWHLAPKMCTSNSMFLTHEVHSFHFDANNVLTNDPIDEDRHMYEPHRWYATLFELRCVKTDFLMHSMPKLVKHYIFFKYENLVTDFHGCMNQIAVYLARKHPLYIQPSWYKNDKRRKFEGAHKDRPISASEYYQHPLFQIIRAQECTLGYRI